MFTDEAEYAELRRLYNFIDDDSVQFTRWNMLAAIRHGKRLANEAAALRTPTPTDARLNEALERNRAILDQIDGGYAFDTGPERVKEFVAAVIRDLLTTDATELPEALKPGDRVTLRPIEDGEIVPGGDHVIASIEEDGIGFRVEGHPIVTVFPHRIIHRHPPG